MPDTHHLKPSSQSGNVFLVVLIGVILFAALAYVVSRGLRSDTTTGISKRQAELAAVDLLDYGQRLERAVTKLSQRGVSENDLDFTNDTVAGYPHTPVQADSHKIFHVSGGHVSWKNPEPDVNDGSPWLFTGDTCIIGVGTGNAGCDSDSASNEELLAILPNIKQSVCEEINRRLNIATMPSGGTLSATKFTGAYADGALPVGADGLTAACVSIGGNYSFYYVLLAR